MNLRKGLAETRETLISLCEIIRELEKGTEKSSENEAESSFDTSTHPSTRRHINSTTPTHNSTDKTDFKAGKAEYLPFSTGNEGVSTDRQTDRQTDEKEENSSKTPQNSIENASELLDSLDGIKKELRLKFKRLTDQEVLVFSAIYQLDSDEGYADYKTLSGKLKLTESSIRDYVQRLLRKGIPVDKNKVNNKSVHLSIPLTLKKVASLQTILNLRGL